MRAFSRMDCCATIGAIVECRALGLEVPRDVSVTGYNDSSLARAFEPAITSVDTPVELHAHEVARVLLAALRERTPIPVLRLPTELRLRASYAYQTRKNVNNSFRLGEDPLQGGLYQYGPIGAAATQRDKVAWVEAEALLATCTSFARTRHADHRLLFLRTLAWVRDHQADWARGGWYGTIDPAGVASGLKADEWSGGYHVGRALIDGLAALEGAG